MTAPVPSPQSGVNTVHVPGQLQRRPTAASSKPATAPRPTQPPKSGKPTAKPATPRKPSKGGRR